MIPALACCKDGDILARRDIGLIDSDFSALMNFFCHSWRGKSGLLSGCQIMIIPENINAWNVFARTGPGARSSDVESAIRMLGIKDARDCWERVSILNEQFAKARKK